MSDPLVSVVMPVYNGEKYVVEAVESILAQTFTDYEFIVVDDGSTDSTPELLKPYIEQGVIVHRQSKNLGLVEALNTGWRMAKGAYIAIMHADDVSLPERLSEQVTYLQSHQAVGIIGSSVQMIERNSTNLDKVLVNSEPLVNGWEIFFACPLAHPTVIIKKHLLELSGGYRQEMLSTEDYDLWARLSQMTLISNVKRVLLHYRVWDGSITANNKKRMEHQSTLICQDLVSKYLNQEITFQEAAILRRLNGATAGEAPKTKQDVLNVAHIFMQLYDRYTSQTELSPSEAQVIATSAALKMMVLSKLAFGFDILLGLRLLVKGLRLSPLALLTAIKTEANKVKAKI